MDIQQLRYFADVASTEHVSRSAENLHISQPSLTQSIGRLERELGVPLFEKRGRGIALTPAGRRLKERAAALVADFDGFKADARRVGAEEDDTVYVELRGGQHLALGDMRDYMYADPGVRFMITGQGNRGLADFRASIRPLLPDDDDRLMVEEGRHSFVEEICLIVPEGHRFEDIVSPGELEDERFIAPSEGEPFRGICDGICRSQGIRWDTSLGAADMMVAARMTELGMGVSFWPIYSWKEINQSGLRLVRIDSPLFRQVVVYELVNHDRPRAAASRFYEYLLNVARTFHSATDGKRLSAEDISAASRYAANAWGGGSHLQ